MLPWARDRPRRECRYRWRCWWQCSAVEAVLVLMLLLVLILVLVLVLVLILVLAGTPSLDP